jgi:twitching motility protein PilI
MTTSAHQAPFQWLQALEQQVRGYGAGLPQQNEVEQRLWQGVAFRLHDELMISPLPEIKEILYYPKTLAKVPGSKPWVLGIANHQGILIPVIDLSACLGGKDIKKDGRSRLLVIALSGITAGLLVNEVLGIKYFPEELKNKLTTQLKEKNYQTFIQECFEINQQLWSIFDMRKLSESRLFLNAAS